jgi:thiazole synthase
MLMTANPPSADTWQVDGVTLTSRFLLGSARYPTPQALRDAIVASGTEVITMGLKRAAQAGADDGFVGAVRDAIATTSAKLLPNTAGCYSAAEAVQLAHMAREIYGTRWIKLEVLGDRATLQPDMFGTVEAAKELVRDGFVVWPYCTDDLVACRRLLDAGCPLLMPWGAPIGSGQGLLNPFALKSLRERLPDTILIVDAGIGAPSHAVRAMELGYDAVLLSTAVGQARDPVEMAHAFRLAVEAGRSAWRAGVMAPREGAVASTPVAPPRK